MLEVQNGALEGRYARSLKQRAAFALNFTRIIHALAASESGVYAGGSFDNIGGQDTHGIAALDATIGLATPSGRRGLAPRASPSRALRPG